MRDIVPVLAKLAEDTDEADDEVGFDSESVDEHVDSRSGSSDAMDT